MANPLARLIEFGQSFWLDNIRRGFTRSGELKRLIDDDGLRGVTSNPTIFEKAIAESKDYDDALSDLVQRGQREPRKIFDEITSNDIREACDVFRELYDASDGGDGYVSIELPPDLAKNTDGSIAEGRRLWKLIDRPNVMVKVPATDEGIPVIRRLISEGVNVNITLMFGEQYYERVIDAYFTGLEDRLRDHLPIDRIASVASCFVSRVDTEADKRIEAALPNADDAKKARLQQLLGRTAIANSKRLYRVYLKSLETERFKKLAAAGARRQRPLWASTSTKNPKYPDTYYVEALIGPDTVDTMPPATIAAFREHGKLARTLDANMEQADATIDELTALGISLKEITDKLLADGLVVFENSFDQLLDVIREKAEKLRSNGADRHVLSGFDQAQHFAELERLERDRFVARVWQRDPTLWKAGDPATAAVVKNRLGWLTIVETMEGRIEELSQFADDARHEGFKHVVLMGMGGSSLAPIVLRDTFGVRPGFPKLLVLDSTVPQAIADLEAQLDIEKTLFIEASKSGTTLESRSFGEYFFEKVKAARGDAAAAAKQFVYITDPGTPLEKLGTERGVRRVFANAPDIGGRYSALSYFGLVPAAIAGYDIAGLLDRAQLMVTACASGVSAAQHPAVSLAVALAQAVGKGRDKLTILSSGGIASLGLWLEQLIAESTGKDGKVLIPVADEPLGDPGAYGDDRIFVHLRLGDDDSLDGRREALRQAGHPLVQVFLRDELDLGEEFFAWEFATAALGSLLGIDPFDEPNVQESKDNTNRILSGSANGELRDGAVGAAKAVPPSDESAIAAALQAVRPHDYIAIVAFIGQTPARTDVLQRIRATLRDATKAATTLGYGPRFLHSTGQMHKGGPNTGVFLQLVGGDDKRIDIPGKRFDFATLKNAQALGDLQSLQNHGRRVIRIDLGPDVDAGLLTLKRTVNAIATHLPVTAATKG
ncbi:MAG: transaldolase [Candidatus Eremiobacter antarcticus]|nr:bifunctional transaldolase/phosoglucose isomerase [Candidatus Eremiobacteraeota bacterium]MBC5808372.1 bifunctional transaldolase/phosoglucose isomerase [Candidatus Eremiobacteraeota bacterium]PZR63738.1 MAG: transaldolase [Candidatus Eremiobacter sp. RRmetagenome_bin22]